VTSERIYLDYAATTPLAPEVCAAMLAVWKNDGFNASSLHAEGRRARAILDDARERVAAALGATRKEIVFTSGGSESDTLALIGVARARRRRGRHIVSTAIEHHAVLHALDALRDDGFDVTVLPVDAAGQVDERAFAAALREDTILASVMYANNEIGSVQPIERLAAAARGRGVVFHTDAIAAPGYLPLLVTALGVDLLSLSAHKFYGPPGVGVLYVREGTPLQGQIFGGPQEYGRRAGTENVASIVGLALALERARDGWEARAAAVAALRDRLEATILAVVPDVVVNGREARRLPNILSVAFLGVDVEQLLVALDLAGVAVSAGSACTSGSLESSHVIEALGDPERARNTIRFSLGNATTAAQIDGVGALVSSIVATLRGKLPTPAYETAADGE
jgi:cysteine desulfurase